MKPLVIYHDKCTDGFGAAFAAWMKLGAAAEYVACSYGQKETVAGNSAAGPMFVGNGDAYSLQDRDVYILDFSFERETTDFLFQHAGRVIWLDHHRTAFEQRGVDPDKIQLLQSGPTPNKGHYILLDNNKSGALLAWEYFHPNVPVPDLIKRIDDRDRWVFQYDDSKALHAGLAAMQPWTFEKWKSLLKPSYLWEVTQRGVAILSAQNSNVERMAQQAMKCSIPAGYIAPDGTAKPSTVFGPLPGLACNAPIHQSELGHVLATRSGTYGLIWYVAADGRVNCSLRSNGDYDVSAIAKAFGGGGHKNAAGFQTDVRTLMGWLK